MIPPRTSPPKPRKGFLADGFTSKRLPELQEQAAQDGYTVIQYNLSQSPMVFWIQRVTPAEADIYSRVATLLKVNVWDMWMEFHWVPNEEEDRGRYPMRIESVVVKRSPVRGLTPGEREKVWRPIIEALPKGSNGWPIEDDQQTGYVTLRYGKALSLPEVVPMLDLLPERITPEDWYNIVLGEDQNRQPVGVNLKDGPHMLVVGPTGSGKTVALTQIAVSAMSRGHEVVLIDTVKGGADFTRFADWFKAVATTEISANDTMLQIYAEVTRRKQILIREGEGFWADLPEKVRREENIAPLTVIIDEFGSLVLQIDIPKGMDKRDPDEFERAQEVNGAKGNVLYYTGKLAREARFVGVHLAIALQRPDAAIMSGELRSNVTSGILLVKTKTFPAPATLTMVFPGAGDEAAQVVTALDNGSRGLALVAAEGGSVSGLKVGFAKASDIPGILEELGVLKPSSWGGRENRRSDTSQPETTDAKRLSDLARLLSE